MTVPPRVAFLILALGAACVLPGCGNKGDLVRPPADLMEAGDAPPADALPPPSEPTEADPPDVIDPPPAADPPSDPATAPVSGDVDTDG